MLRLQKWYLVITRYFRAVSIWSTLFNSVQVVIYLVGGVLVFWIFSKIGNSIGSNTWPPNIEKISSWSQIIIAYAAIFAIGQYAVAYADIADRKTNTVLEFVRLFREVVLGKLDEIKMYSRKNTLSLPLLRITKNTPLLKFTAEEFFNRIALNKNNELVEKYTQMLVKDPVLESKIVACLNSLEEFSIGILNTKSQDHNAVLSTKKPFVEIVEVLAIPLYFQIGIMADNFVYLSELYRFWKKDVGFCPQSKEDRDERYTQRARQFKKNH